MGRVITVVLLLALAWAVGTRVIEVVSPVPEDPARQAFVSACYADVTRGKTQEELAQTQHELKRSLNPWDAFSTMWWRARTNATGDVSLEGIRACTDKFLGMDFGKLSTGG